jgi:septum site-determining protein MinC
LRIVDVQTASQVTIKGIREGLLVTLEDSPQDALLDALAVELEQKREFLKGSKIILSVGERSFTRRQLGEIKELFEGQELTLWTVLAEREGTRTVARDLGLATRLPGSWTDLEGNALPAVGSNASSDATRSEDRSGASRLESLLLKETLRSGRSVYYEGHVVVIGDVNPGAEIMAAGDVIVWGRLRGLVHAGALGDESAVICSLDLSPTQLRIGNQIAVPPDENRQKPVPEKAFIRSGQIIAEPWQSRS